MTDAEKIVNLIADKHAEVERTADSECAFWVERLLSNLLAEAREVLDASV